MGDAGLGARASPGAGIRRKLGGLVSIGGVLLPVRDSLRQAPHR